ncbi:MAG: hypothetical protein JWP89_2978 [Schlesneria sp.]|nr:hypothetical protein [Schlesneria sp.]
MIRLRRLVVLESNDPARPAEVADGIWRFVGKTACPLEVSGA